MSDLPKLIPIETRYIVLCTECLADACLSKCPECGSTEVGVLDLQNGEFVEPYQPWV